MRVLLVRHGQTYANVELALDTAYPGADLTPEGQSQAQAVAKRLVREPVDALVATNLLRTQQTAAPAAELLGLDLQIEPGWREISAGDMEMLNDRDSFMTYHRSINAWVYGDLDVRMPGGESGEEVFARANEALENVYSRVGDEGTAVIVAHGAIMRTWTGYHAVNIDPSFVSETLIPNTGILELERRDGDWHLLKWVGQDIGS